MSSASKIEWTEQTWNPLVGCTIVSPGCTHCYAMRTAARLSNNPATPHYAGTVKTVNGKPVWTGTVALAPERVLTEPLRRKKPTMYFVNSMSDLFHESVPDEWIDKVFAVMALTPQHTYQVLTKRAERMREYVTAVANSPQRFTSWAAVGCDIARAVDKSREVPPRWPLPNVWFGVSTERQKEADERIPHLLQTPAAVRFISAEPLLGPLDLWNGDPDPRLGGHEATHTFLGDWWEPGDDPKGPSRHGVDWVIAGGESGPGARPSHPDWFRSLRDQCAAAEVPFFFKQWGAYKPNFPQYGSEFGVEDDDDWMCSGRDFPDEGVLYRSGHFYDGVEYQPHVGEGAYWVERVGKKAAGRLLDNRTHDDMPGRG